jgi:hypothetical protein
VKKPLEEFAEEQESFDLAGELLRAKNRMLAADVRRLAAIIEEQQRKLDVLSAVDSLTCNAPNWKRPAKGGKGHKGIANLVLSDLHLDEVVDPATMGGVNGYNRRIAELRLRRTFERFVVVAQDYVGGISYEGAVLPLIGDLFSGNIHEELRATNEASIIESVDYWIDPMVAGIRMVADTFGRVHLPCIVGNHGRNTYKPIHKGSVKDNFDWLYVRQLARALAGDRRVTFDVPEATWVQHTQYGTTFHYEHGDRGFKGGNGIAGIFSPLRLGDMKLRKTQSAIGKPYDVLVLGHFHTLLSVPTFGLIVNGSLKGYDEYARDNKFGFEPPQQAFWVTTPENGVTFSAAIRPMQQQKEGW